MGFGRVNFRGLFARTAFCPLSLQTIAEKTFADRHKTAKFTKVFSLESFPLYGIIRVPGFLSSIRRPLIIFSRSLE